MCRSDAHLLPRETEFVYCSQLSPCRIRINPQVSHLTLHPRHFFFLSSFPSLLNDRSSTGQPTTQLPKDQLEVRLWWWPFKGQRAAGLVSPRLPSGRRRTPILRYSFPFFFCRQPSLLHIGHPTNAQCSWFPHKLHIRMLIPRFFPTHNPPLFQMVFFKRTNKATG